MGMRFFEVCFSRLTLPFALKSLLHSKAEAGEFVHVSWSDQTEHKLQKDTVS